MDAQQREVDRNYARFSELLPEILSEHRGHFALMKGGEIVRYFPTAQQADLYGMQQYEDGIFSVQEVSDIVLQSGAFTHATV